VIDRSPRARREAGVSLVELVVAISVGGLLLALAVGGQGLVSSRRLTGMARKLASDMRMLEQRARTERTCYRIVFNPGAEHYTMERYDGTVTAAPAGGGSQCNDSSWTGPVVVETSGDSVSRRMPRGINLVRTNFGLDTLIFSPLGNPPAGAVTLQTPSGMEREVVIEAMGRVRILP
jgi:Tfp pilus assembly protein FimT